MRLFRISHHLFWIISVFIGSSLAVAAPDTAPTKVSLVNHLNRIITCINAHSTVVHASYNRYLEWVDEEHGPTGRERYIARGLLPVSDISDCRTIKHHSAIPNLYRHVANFIDAFEQLAPLVNRMVTYYQQYHYLQDDLALGKEKHPDLILLFEDFFQADKTLRQAVKSVQTSLETSAFRNIAIQTHASTHLLLVKSLSAARTSIHQILNADSVFMLEPDALRTAAANYAQKLQDVEKRLGNQKPAPANLSRILTYITRGKSYLNALNMLIKRVEAHQYFTANERFQLAGGDSWRVNGSPSQLSHHYNMMIEAYNAID
jgi:hypothetical protein